jgi:hypothetical protein
MNRTNKVLLLAGLAACGASHYELDTPTSVADPGPQAVGIVRIDAPWYAPRFVIARKFRAAVPEYEALPDLEAKFFTISDDKRFGGIYLWSTRAAAEAFYSDAWRSGIRERRGVDPDLVVMDAPFVVRGDAAIHGEPLGERSIDYPGTATLVLWSLDSGTAIDAARALAAELRSSKGLVRGAALVGDGHVGFVALWATRDLAEAALESIHHPGLKTTFFDAPVIIDASLR